MKILVLSSGIRVGGFSKSLVYMLECLHSRGVQADLMLLRRTEDEWLLDPVASIKIIENELTNEFVRDESTKMRKFLGILLTGRLLGRLKYLALKQILHRGHEVPSSDRLRAMQLDDERRALGLRCRLNLRDEYDCVVSWEESLCNYILASKIDARRKVGYVHPDYVEAGFDAARDRRMLGGLDAVAMVSEASRESFCRAIPELASKALVIPNLLNVAMLRELARSHPEDMPVCEGEFIIVTVCRLHNISKALDRAARLCARLKLDGFHFKWFFVGAGPDEHLMREAIVELDIQSHLILLGERRNPYPYIRAADLLVLQSYYEGRPLVVDEAKILATPVLVTDYAAAREQVKEQCEGFVVENAEDQILECLRRILAEPSCLIEIRETLATRTWEELTDCSPFLRACEQ